MRQPADSFVTNTVNQVDRQMHKMICETENLLVSSRIRITISSTVFLWTWVLLGFSAGNAAPPSKASPRDFNFLTFCGPFMEELQRMDGVHRDPDRHEGNGSYFDNRDHTDYRTTLIGYGRILRDLQEKGGVVIDIGSGQAIAAQLAVIAPRVLHPDFQIYALDLFRPLLGRFLTSSFKGRESQFIYLEGHYLEEYYAPDAESRGLILPEADLISDYLGADAYGLHFDRNVEFELRSLKVGGYLTISIYHDNTVIHGNAGAHPIKNLTRWFYGIKGAHVVDKVIDGKLFNILLKKTSKEITVQPLEVLTFEADQPPWRTYLLQK
jgi:hypothetical protein